LPFDPGCEIIHAIKFDRWNDERSVDRSGSHPRDVRDSAQGSTEMGDFMGLWEIQMIRK
jgi:hypothetical protein